MGAVHYYFFTNSSLNNHLDPFYQSSTQTAPFANPISCAELCVQCDVHHVPATPTPRRVLPRTEQSCSCESVGQ